MQTLLIADDDPDLRLLLQTTLEDPAYRILEASDGESALHLVRQERPDVVILDRMNAQTRRSCRGPDGAG